MEIVRSVPFFKQNTIPASRTTSDPFKSDIIQNFNLNFPNLPLPSSSILNTSQQTTALKSKTGDDDFIDAVAGRMNCYMNVKEIENPSELLLRDFHFTIPLFVHHSITNLFRDKKFEFKANQEIGKSGYRPDNYFYFQDESKIVPLLVGEDKATLKNTSDVLKSLNILREETRHIIETALQKGYTQIEQSFTPVVLISKKTYFQIYVFQKVLRRESAHEHSTNSSMLHPVELQHIHKKDLTYDLLDIEDVYYAIRTITALIYNSIKWYEKVASAKTVDHNTILQKSTFKVKTNQFQYYQSFALSQGELFAKSSQVNYCVHVYKTDDKSVVVKYVEEKERRLYELAAAFSPKTLRANIVQIEEKYNQVFKSIVFDYEENGIAVLKDGNTIQDRCGTSAFMAPEVSMSRSYGCKVDCYSCGVVILHLIAQYLNCSARFEQKEQISVENISAFFDELTDLSFKKYKELVLGLVKNDPQYRLSAQQALEMVKTLTTEPINPSNKAQPIFDEYTVTNIDNNNNNNKEESEKETNQQEPKFKKAKYE